MKKRVSLAGKRKKRLLAILVPAAMLMTLFGSLSAAAAEEEYTYTVRFLGGAQGAVTADAVSASGGTIQVVGNDVVCTNLKKGTRVSFDVSGVKVNNAEKYRATESRLSGRDNQEAAARVQSFSVSEDRDCVVAYAVRSANETAYTIYYRDTAGNDIVAPVTLHGNPGETMIVGAKWSDTHFPNTYKIGRAHV